MVKVDWAFTEDGDLELGDSKLDDSGKVLYLHSNGTLDTDKREDGKEVRDIGVIQDLEAEKQIIFNRLRSDAPEWYHHPTMAGNLTDLIGEPNTRQTATMGEARIIAALTYNKLYDSSQISVHGVPISSEEVVFMISIIKYGNKVTRLPLIFNLQKGLMDFYVTPKPTEGV